MSLKLPFEEQFQDHFLAYQLLKRKLRTPLVSQVVKSLNLRDLRNMYRAIHPGEKPCSGCYPAIQAIPQSRESFLYIALFASIYRTASSGNFKSEIDIAALLFAWDFFCEYFPNHVRERRPFGKIRPANFTEAWVIIMALKNGNADLHYCSKCHGDFIIIHGSNYSPTCQICIVDSLR